MSGVDWKDYQGEDTGYTRAKALDTGIDKRTAAAAAHTVVTRVGDEVHVEHFGPGQVIQGSVQDVWLEPGETLVIRHLAPASGGDTNG